MKYKLNFNLNYLRFFLIIFLFFLFIFDYKISDNQGKFLGGMSWDEVDYAQSAKKGLFENAFEFNSTNFFNFIQLGYLKYTKQDNEININKLNLKKEDNDVFYLRHFHSPISSYYWSFFTNENIKIQDINLKKSLKYLSYIVIFLIFLFFTVHENFIKNFFIKFSLIIFLFYSHIFSKVTDHINYHLFFSLNAIVYLHFFNRYIKEKNFQNSLYLSFFSAILLISLETAIFVFFSSFLFLIFFRKKITLTKSDLIILIILTVLFTLLLWPANIYNFSIIKSYMMYIYRIIIKLNVEFSEVAPLLFWPNLFLKNYVLFFAILFLFFNILINYKTLKIEEILPLFHGIFYLVLISPFIVHGNYVLPSVIIIIYSLIIYLNKNVFYFEKTINYSFFLCLIIFLFIHFKNIDYYSPPKRMHHIDKAIKYINSYNGNKPVLIDGGHIFKYYSKYNKIHDLHHFQFHKPKFYIRENFIYINVFNKIKKNHYSIILIQKDRLYSKKQYEQILSFGYTKIANLKYNIFVLNSLL